MDEDRVADLIVVGAILTIIILKITGVIKLSWFWLLSPVWLLLSAGVILAIIVTIGCLINTIRRTKNERN